MLTLKTKANSLNDNDDSGRDDENEVAVLSENKLNYYISERELFNCVQKGKFKLLFWFRIVGPTWIIVYDCTNFCITKYLKVNLQIRNLMVLEENLDRGTSLFVKKEKAFCICSRK